MFLNLVFQIQSSVDVNKHLNCIPPRIVLLDVGPFFKDIIPKIPIHLIYIMKQIVFPLVKGGL